MGHIDRFLFGTLAVTSIAALAAVGRTSRRPSRAALRRAEEPSSTRHHAEPHDAHAQVEDPRRSSRSRFAGRRVLVGVVAATIVFSTAFAAAASLTVNPAGLGAGTADVASCDTDGVGTTYTVSYSSSLAGYKVANVNVTGIATPGCDGRSMKVTLVGAGDASLAEQTTVLTTPAADPTTLSFASSDVLASLVLKVSVVIY